MSSEKDNIEEEVILVEEFSEGKHETMFLRSSDMGGEFELVFFRRLDDEFNKVLKFYKGKVGEMMEEAEELNKQMDALIALRIRVDNPVMVMNGEASGGSTSSSFINGRNPGNRNLNCRLQQWYFFFMFIFSWTCKQYILECGNQFLYINLGKCFVCERCLGSCVSEFATSGPETALKCLLSDKTF